MSGRALFGFLLDQTGGSRREIKLCFRWLRKHDVVVSAPHPV